LSKPELPHASRKDAILNQYILANQKAANIIRGFRSPTRKQTTVYPYVNQT
jgi:hypothetical protein